MCLKRSKTTNSNLTVPDGAKQSPSVLGEAGGRHMTVIKDRTTQNFITVRILLTTNRKTAIKTFQFLKI